MDCPLTGLPGFLPRKTSSDAAVFNLGAEDSRGCFSIPGQPRMDLRRVFLQSLLEKTVWQDCKDRENSCQEFETFCYITAFVQL